MNYKIGRMNRVFVDEIENFAVIWREFKNKVSLLPSDFSKNIFKENLLWERLLFGKILPHLEGEGCLVIAVAGGTNTGKSTLLNVLLKKEFTPVHPFAAATKRPVLISSKNMAQQCLQNKLFLEFDAKEMENKEEAISESLPLDILLIKEDETLPDTYLYLDTPDIDSIQKEHWDIAEKIVSAGDIIIAVLVDVKYKDDAVVQFFLRACYEGKIVIPVMNKVYNNDPESLQITKEQIKDFMKEVGLNEDDPCFYFLIYPRNENFLNKPIPSLSDNILDLRDYIRSFPVRETKEKVMKNTIDRFNKQFCEWFNKTYIPQLNSFQSRIENYEYHLRKIVEADFNPFAGFQLEKELEFELRKQIGYFRYLVLLPASIFSGHRSIAKRLEGQKKDLEIVINEQHKLMIEKCVGDFLESLIKFDFVPEIDSLNKYIKGRLHLLNNQREQIFKNVLIRVEKKISTTPKGMEEEIKKIVQTFLESPELKGLKRRRLLSWLIVGMGTGALFFTPILYSTIPILTSISQSLIAGGTMLGSALLEVKSYRDFLYEVKNLHAQWVQEKREEFFQILKDEILYNVLGVVYDYIKLADQLKGEAEKIFSKELNVVQVMTETVLKEDICSQ